MDKIRILVIEDDRPTNHLISHYLMKEGYTVISALHGLEALDHVYRHGYRLVILDLTVPYVDGYDILGKIKEKADTPVLILSDKSIEADKLSVFGLSPNDCIKKPFSVTELMSRVKILLQSK